MRLNNIMLNDIQTHDWTKDINKIPSFSPSVLSVLKLIEDGVSDTSLIEKKLNEDPVIVGRILNLANSSYYGLSGKIYNIADACIILGMHTIKNIVIMATSMSCFDIKNSHCGLNHTRFWKHSLISARYTKELAIRKKMNADIAFVSGLLFDIGIIPQALKYPLEFKKIHDDLSLGQLSRGDLENKTYGITHTKITKKITEHWGLPSEIVNAVDMDNTHKEKRTCDYSVLIQVADIVANGMGFGIIEKEAIADVDISHILSLGITWEDFEYLSQLISPEDYKAMDVS